jgi:predicted Fe-Mo cluster-binding NifX family protein
MKIVITVKGTDLDSEVDPRFGRAQNFLLVDTESGEASLIDNQQNVNALGGAGVSSAEAIAETGAEALLTGHCGPNAFMALNAAGVKVVVGVEGIARDALERLKNGEYKFSESADVERHW